MKSEDVISKPILRYSNCWEDAEVLLSAVGDLNDKKILSIGSAGDNSFSLLSRNPEKIIVADTNLIQIHLIELKKAAIKILSYENFLEFLGFKNGNRALHFASVKDYLPENSLLFWEDHFELIEKGIIYQGKFEKYLLFFREYVLPLIHGDKTINQLTEQKTTPEQESFYSENWNNRRWKFLFKLFFGRYSLGKFGRDPEFTRYVTVNISDQILKQVELHLKSELCQTNPFLEFILKKKFVNHLPHYAQEVNFKRIKENIDKLEVIHSDVLPLLNNERFDILNLSNIFEYMNEELVGNYAESITKNCLSGSILVYWNLMVPRKLSTSIPGKFQLISSGNSFLRSKDYGFFYSDLIVEKLK